MKNENVLYAMKAAELFHLSLGAFAAQEALLRAIKTVCRVYYDDLLNFHQPHELRGEKDLFGIVNLLLCDPSYNRYRW